MVKDNRRRTFIGQPINPEMGRGRYQDALRRLRNTIANDAVLEMEDSCTIGNKYTNCTWGLCSEELEQWPDKDDHTFPDDFVKDGRITTRDHLGCPLDARTSFNELGPSCGCFHGCRVFHQDRYGKLTKKTTLELFDVAIKGQEEKYGKLTAADDGEDWG